MPGKPIRECQPEKSSSLRCLMRPDPGFNHARFNRPQSGVQAKKSKKIFPSRGIWILFLPLFFLLSCNRVEQVDLIVDNAVVYTVDSTFRTCESFAVDKGKIVAVGTSEQISGKYKAHQNVNLMGKPVYPGFIDAHCHFYQYGLSLQEADLTGTSSFSEILKIVGNHAEKIPSGWIIGRGWDQNDWAEETFPDRDELDTMFPTRPVVLFRIDGHAALVNETALKLAGIDRNTEIFGGECVKKNGKLTGILIDNAVNFIRRKMPEPDDDQIRKALLDAQYNCFKTGLTSLHDAGLDARIIDNIDELNRKDSLLMRIYAMLNPGEKNFKAYMYRGIFKTDRLHVASIKLFADGALGSRGAKMLKPYQDDPSNTGLFVMSPSYIQKMAVIADSFGYQVNTHCIGDAANDTVLHIYASILKGKNDKRWRIEHAQVLAPRDFNFFGKYSIVASVQPTHATSDMYWVRERIGDRVDNAYAYKRLLDQRGWIADGSDFPVESINPVYGFYAAFTRKDLNGYPSEGFQRQDALTRKEALKAMTIWAARAAFEEKEKGSLEPGKFADFVVLDRDIMKVPPAEVSKVRVLYTFVDGKCVWKSN